MINEKEYRILIEQLATGGITGNKTYHQYHDQFVPIDSEGAGYANGGGVGSMMQPKKNFKMQGGVRNYLGKQKEVKAPLKWQSSPNHPTTELAYITQKEKDLLVKSDLHGSLKGGVNRGPSGIMSLNGWGSADPGQNVSGAAASAAESGKNTSDTLAAGMSHQDVKDWRSAAINAGAGQRVNPGFFDSRTNLTPEEIALAKSYRNDPANIFANQAYKNTGQTGLRSFISGGGILGALVRGLGQKFGLGKKAGEATYDMSEFSDYGIGGTPPGTLDFDPNAKIQDTSFITENIINKDLVPPSKPEIKNIDVGFDDPAFENDLMAKLNTLETREYNNLKTGNELNMNTPKQNERLEELEQKKNEANIIGSSTAIV
jgi:hypothetical protein